ncbi:MAG: exodeoxyribonuclease III [Flavobacteriales bacterium]|nr:MAG: exodeoxyribonuclease III [Flavobacteriales bacterium]
MTRIVSWNVNGLRAIVKKNFFEAVDFLQADVICLQETKAQNDEVQKALFGLNGYHVYVNSAERKGYSGVAVLSKMEAISVSYGIGMEEHDAEGRVITLEFADYFIVGVYVPNSGNALVRLPYRREWDKAFLAYADNLAQVKPVVLCGDLNVAHQAIDLARPEANYNKTPGYTQDEIDGFQAFIDRAWVDTFRYLHPDTVRYSWWSYRGGARERNVGWRLDYLLVSPQLVQQLIDSFIYTEITGSDHCPVAIEIR